MGIFDNIAGYFTGETAANAADKTKAGLQAGYGQASDLFGQGRGALNTNYAAALAPFTQNFATAQGGQNAYADATGANGPAGGMRARASFQADPGYNYRIEQGNENVLRNASRTGGLGGGGVNVDLLKLGQGEANQGWQQYIQNLLPFLGGANSAASGIAGVNTGLGNALNANYGTQANAAYGTQAGMGNADASAELAKNSGVGNMINLGQQAVKLGASVFGGGFAEGGRPPVGVPSVVGEQGPEMFVPDQPGTVVPNWMLERPESSQRPEVGPFPNMGNPIRPNPLSPSYNLNMGAPAAPSAPRAPGGLAAMLLQAFGPQGLSIPAR